MLIFLKKGESRTKCVTVLCVSENLCVVYLFKVLILTSWNLKRSTRTAGHGATMG